MYVTFYKMAVRTGLEPATSCVTGRHSNQLNYRTLHDYSTCCGEESWSPPEQAGI
ncbi:hypothetical protein MUY_004472 [Bacillus licheniformis WX-02]|nr:hypothetical protein MUY_004472 [Bacillus licheniformis WX-02]